MGKFLLGLSVGLFFADKYFVAFVVFAGAAMMGAKNQINQLDITNFR